MWIYDNKPIEEIPDGAFGFIYLITNLETNKKYIGRKNLKIRQKKKINTLTKQAKSRKKTVVTIKESNWKTYTGSNAELNEIISKVGIEKFKFEILEFAFTQGQLNYLEENAQHFLNVTLRQDFYNSSIGSRGFISMRQDDYILKSTASLRHKLKNYNTF